MDLHILQYQSIPSTQTTDDYLNALRNITNGGARIIMVAATSTPQVEILMQAQKMGLINKNYVWLMMGDTTTELSKTIIEYNDNNTANPTSQINYAVQYQGLFFFDNWLSLNGYPPFENFLDQWSSLNPEA
jgi:hypothetical protein